MEHLILSCLESRLEEGGSLYGRFLVGPFRLGQGITVATALRRTLLSELQGIAITAVEIVGAAHQYSSIVGVRESALDITLNLKQVVLAGRSSIELPAIGYINVLGPKEVRGSDLRLPNGISCVNSNQHIATVSSTGGLLMKFVISSGTGYITHHSAPAQSLNPFILSARGPGAGSAPLPAVVREGEASKPSLPARPGGGVGYVGSDSRYGRRLARRAALSSGGGNAVASYAQDRRTPPLPQRGKGATGNGTAPHGKQDHATPGALAANPPPPSSREPASKPLPMGEAVPNRDPAMTPKIPLPTPKGDPPGGIAGVASHPYKSTLGDGEGWPAGPQGRASLHRRAGRDMFFAAVARRSDDLIEETGGGDHGHHLGALESNVGGEGGESPQALGNRSLLPIDAVFMPVNSVNFSVERDEQWEEPKERVVLELWTNGSVSPRQALHEAATCLVYMFSLFRQSPGILPLTPSLNKQPQPEKRAPLGRATPSKVGPDRVSPALVGASGALGQPGHAMESRGALARAPVVGRVGGADLEDLHLSVPAYVALKQSRIHTLHDLLLCAPPDLTKMVGGNEEISFEILARLREVTS